MLRQPIYANYTAIFSRNSDIIFDIKFDIIFDIISVQF